MKALEVIHSKTNSSLSLILLTIAIAAPALGGAPQQLILSRDSQPQGDEQNYGRRPLAVLCELGWIFLQRQYLYSPRKEQGHFPLDAALGLIDGYSPGVARWMCRAGTLAGNRKEPIRVCQAAMSKLV